LQTSAFFGTKNFGFFEFMVCPRTDKGGGHRRRRWGLGDTCPTPWKNPGKSEIIQALN